MPEGTKRVEVVTNLSGPTRRQVFMGREHIAVPAVLVKSKILHNNLGRTYLPPEDITPEWAETANGAPAVSDHPATGARDPHVLNEMGVGWLFNAEARDGALHGEVLLDPARAGDVPDLRVILARLEAGDKVEVSTGFPVAIDPTPGALNNGEEYDVVIHPAGFDHLAVFAEKIGACSVSDGCGLAQNHDGPCEDEEEAVNKETEGKLATALNKLMAFLSGQEDEAEEAGDTATNTDEEDEMREQLIAQLAEAGPLDEQALNKLSDCQLKALAGAEEAPTTNEVVEGDSVAWQKAREWREKYETLEAETENARKAEEQEKAKLLDDILYAQNRAYTDQEVRAMDIVQLRKLHKTMFPPRADFSGRGGPSTNGVNSFDFVKPIMDGPAGTSVLDREEAN